MTRGLNVRARIEPRREPPFDRVYDPLIDDLVDGGELSHLRFPTRWSDTPALERLVAAKRAPLDAALHRELVDYHRRLGASTASLASLDRLARGEAVCAVAGQQPAPLGGPLYSLHKTACAVGLAAVVTARTGAACVPMFWMHGEDSDFVEIRSATLVDRELKQIELQIPERFHVEGGLVGSIPAEALDELHATALRHWAELPSRGAVETLMARGAARDLGEVYSAAMLRLFGDRGLVVIDPRLPAFRAAARPIIDRYLAKAEELGAAARASGQWLEERMGRRPLADSALESFVFRIDDGVRRKLTIDEARRLGPNAVLSPSVALRAALQDSVFPTVAMACGAAEIAYLAQLREVFEGLGVRPASPVPRLTATWLPAGAVELTDAARVTPWDVVVGADGVLKDLAERSVPADAREDLDRARADSAAHLDRVARSARQIDPSLDQMVDSARGKIDYQFARLNEGVVGKVRHRLERQHPAWARLRYVLMPGEKLQERRLASFQIVAERGIAVSAELADLAAEQAERLAGGTHEHLLLDL